MESIACKILNIQALSLLEEENEKLADDMERKTRELLLEAIWDKITDYDAHIFKYEYNKHWAHLVDRGVEFTLCEKDTLSTRWDLLFSSLVPEDIKKSTCHYSDQYKWHIFSFNLLNAQQGTEAKMAFDAQEKDELYMFFQYGEKAFHIRNANLLRADDLDVLNEYSTWDNSDIYLFDPLSKWTYVKTHEETCGPYLYHAK